MRERKPKIYPNKVKSSAYGMDDAAELISSMGAQTEWDDKTKQNYAQWEGDGGVYKILVRRYSVAGREAESLFKENQLAGVAEWSLGMEGSGVWDLILQYVN